MTKSFQMSLHLSQVQKSLIDRAAQIASKSHEDFILEHCLFEAKEIVIDSSRCQLNSAQWEAMQKALDSPPSHGQLQGLKKLFAVKTPWEK